MKKASNKSVIGMAILTGAILLAGGGLTYWQWSQLSSASKRVADLRQQVDGQGDVDAQLKTIQAQVQESQLKLDHLEQGVPARAYIPTMMKELETIGRQNGIQVLGVRPMPPKFGTPPPSTGAEKDGDKPKPERKAYDEQFIEVKGNGEYLNVLSFLSALERFPKIVAVSQVMLLPKEKSPDEEVAEGVTELEITVELRAFLFPNEMPKKAEKVATKEKTYGQG